MDRLGETGNPAARQDALGDRDSPANRLGEISRGSPDMHRNDEAWNHARSLDSSNRPQPDSNSTNLWDTTSQNGEFRSLLDGDVYGKPFAKALLLRLEEADQDESVTKDYSGRITIEHVLPQALKDDYWRERFSEDNHHQWLHRLGNLVLLAGSKNYKAQYFDFDRKKKIYSKRNSKVSFDTTKEILAQDDWNADAISSRHVEMVAAANSIWAIK